MNGHHTAHTAHTAILSEIGDRWVSRTDLLKKFSKRYSGALIIETIGYLISIGVLCSRLDATADREHRSIRRSMLRPSYARRRDPLDALNMIVPGSRPLALACTAEMFGG